ncbi:SIS domain-containing protein [Bailinhaonella thermotolerans]|uniref:Sugar isomerase n=1 Tax=Bailinhaonella thermotolerans TaxID=1070861 RepID=A0A3A4B711_9ACTN|nr:sugar isomerase [Bailinhaonella thermotolerans]RJL34357.1 sugar isomerase [Bailinhaonella thermotolerans]
MSHVAAEIASQPDCWRRAIDIAPSAAGLPLPGERVAVIGCGTSLYMAQAYAVLRERAGQGETDAFAASEFPRRPYDRVLAITRSGTTTEVLAALEATSSPTTAITGDPNTPIMDVAGQVVVLDFADEKSVVQTRFATTGLVLLRAHLGQAPDDLVAQAENALAADLPENALDRRQYTFLGAGWTNGLAQEAGLKLREAAGAWAEAYPGMEYRHGPISVADERSLIWSFGRAPEGLLDDVRATGATAVESAGDPLADLIRAQRLAVALAEAQGLDPDQPRNLTRSVILT